MPTEQLSLIYDPRDKLRIFIRTQPDQYRSDFADWIEANWSIWDAFKAQADKVWNSGRRHYSARTIVEFLRHETSLREVDSEWKVSNNVVPDLSRLYTACHPERRDFFSQHTTRKAA